MPGALLLGGRRCDYLHGTSREIISMYWFAATELVIPDTSRDTAIMTDIFRALECVSSPDQYSLSPKLHNYWASYGLAG
jgi:hypothetical protein